MNVLVTGFDPFQKETINPSFEAVKRLPQEIAGATIKTVEIPTSFERVGSVLEHHIDEFKPDVVVCVGQAGGRECINIERIAVNMRDAKGADNDGVQPVDEMISPDGKTAYFSTLPIKELLKNLKQANIPCTISNTAGLFVCNNVMYHALQYIEHNDLKVMSGFIHVPYLPEQVIDKENTASMSLELIVEALEIIVSTCVESFKENQ